MVGWIRDSLPATWAWTPDPDQAALLLVEQAQSLQAQTPEAVAARAETPTV